MFRECDVGEKGIVLEFKQTDEKVIGGVSLWVEAILTKQNPINIKYAKLNFTISPSCYFVWYFN